MLFKTTPKLIFFSMVIFFGGENFCTNAFAAKVFIAKEQPSLTTKIKHTPDNIPFPLSVRFTKTNTIYFPVKSIKISDFTKQPSTKPAQKPLSPQNNKILYTSLYEQGEKFFIDHKHNETLKSSLIIFSQTKQFLKETDLMLHNLTQNILASLNLNSSESLNLFFQKENPNIVTSINNNQPTSRNYKNKIDTTSLQESNRFNTKDAYIYNDNDIFNLIFNRTNLYYLLAITFLFLIGKQSIKLLFMKKQFDSQNRR